MSKNPDTRFSVRIQQLRTGAWATCNYSPTLRGALEAAHKQPARDYVWAVFDGRTKVVDCRGWSGDIDFECEVYAALPRIGNLPQNPLGCLKAELPS